MFIYCHRWTVAVRVDICIYVGIHIHIYIFIYFLRWTVAVSDIGGSVLQQPQSDFGAGEPFVSV